MEEQQFDVIRKASRAVGLVTSMLEQYMGLVGEVDSGDLMELMHLRANAERLIESIDRIHATVAGSQLPPTPIYKLQKAKEPVSEL